MASWVRGKCIGKGAFGTVNVAVDKSEGRVFAVKSVDRKMGLPGQLEALENEIRILRGMSSPHVVAFLGEDVTCEGATPYRNLHLEYLPGGTVADLDADVDERVVRFYTWCLVNALRHVHAKGVVHCDVKGRNVLVGGNGCVAKLADLGSAVEVTGRERAAGILPRGSPLWMAPEVIRREYQGPESDVWSLGCTLIEMLAGKPAWDNHGIDTLNRIGYSGELPVFPSRLSEVGRDFLEKCLRREPMQRWSCDQLLQHPFLLSVPPNKLVESSPRCVLDRVDSDFGDSEDDGEEDEEVDSDFRDPEDDGEEDEEKEKIKLDHENSAKERIGKLATRLRVNWEIEGWVEARALSSQAEATGAGDEAVCGDEGEGTHWEIGNMERVEEGMEVGTSSEYSDLGSRAKDERANLETWKFGGGSRLVWRCERDQSKSKSKSEFNRNGNRNRGGGCGRRWNCRCGYGHGYGWEKVDRIKGLMSIYSLCCKILKSHYLLSIYLNILCFSIIYIAYFLQLVIKTCSSYQGRNILKKRPKYNRKCLQSETTLTLDDKASRSYKSGGGFRLATEYHIR